MILSTASHAHARREPQLAANAGQRDKSVSGVNGCQAFRLLSDGTFVGAFSGRIPIPFIEALGKARHMLA